MAASGRKALFRHYLPGMRITDDAAAITKAGIDMVFV